MENLSELIKALQNVQENQSALLAIGDERVKAEAELKAVQSKLESVKRELQSQTAGLTQAQVEVKRNYEQDLSGTQAKLKEVQGLLANSAQKLSELDAQVRAKQELHDMVVRSLDVLRGRIEGKAA